MNVLGQCFTHRLTFGRLSLLFCHISFGSLSFGSLPLTRNPSAPQSTADLCVQHWPLTCGCVCHRSPRTARWKIPRWKRRAPIQERLREYMYVRRQRCWRQSQQARCCLSPDWPTAQTRGAARTLTRGECSLPARIAAGSPPAARTMAWRCFHRLIFAGLPDFV